MTAGVGREAEELLKFKKSEEALALLDNSLADAPDDLRLNELRGLALVQLGRIDEATETFRRATVLAPHRAESFYTLGVHLFDTGQKDVAAENAREALRLDPTMTAASRLLRRCGQDPRGSSDPKAPGRRVPLVAGMGKGWYTAGAVILAIGLLAAVLRTVHPPVTTVAGGGFALVRDPLATAGLFLHIVSSIATFVWVLFDVVDKRDRFIWLVPMFVFAFCGYHALPFALYLYMSRTLAKT